MELFKLLGRVVIENEEAKAELRDTTKESKNTAEGIDKVDDSAKKASKGGFTILKGAAANLVAQGLTKVTSAMGGLIRDGKQYQTSLEQYSISFETMTGSADKAKQITSELGEVAKKTPFELPQLADTTQLLMNYGLTADDAMSRMQMLGDISQGNADKMTRIATAYGQMSSAGKVSLEDVKQMIEAGFNPLNEISQTTGESMSSLYDRISKGTISVDEITDSMIRSTSEGGKYFGAMDAQSESFEGRMSTLRDTVNNAFGVVLAPLMQQAADVWIPAVTVAIENVTVKFQEFGQWISENQGLMILLGSLIGIVTAALVAHSIAQKIKVAMDKAEVTSINALISAKLASAGASMAALGPYLLVVAAITAVIAVIVLCVKHWDQIKAKVTEVAGSIKAKIDDLKEAFSEKVEAIKTTVSNGFRAVKDFIVNPIKNAYITVKDTFTNIKNAIKDKIDGARDTVKSAIDKIKGFFNFKVSLPHIKLPHFSIKPSGWELGDLLKGSIPKLGISWYAKGAIFDQPTILPTVSGLKGVGEAGAEAVAPISVLQKYINDAVGDKNGGIEERLDRLIDIVMLLLEVSKQSKGVYLDRHTLVGELAGDMDIALGEILSDRERGQ